MGTPTGLFHNEPRRSRCTVIAAVLRVYAHGCVSKRAAIPMSGILPSSTEVPLGRGHGITRFISTIYGKCLFHAAAVQPRLNGTPSFELTGGNSRRPPTRTHGFRNEGRTIVSCDRRPLLPAVGDPRLQI